MSLIEEYVDGWRRHDLNAVLACLHDSCEIVECYGPIYRGISTVEQWMTKWCETGQVLSWEVSRIWSMDNFEAAEWHFVCRVDGTQHEFDGASVCDIENGKIRYLREFATTNSLYEWTGEWRT